MIPQFLPSLAAALLLAGPAAGAPAPQDGAPAAAVERATEWPEGPSEKALTKTIGKLRKAASDEMVAQGFAEVREAGAGAAPGLLAALSKERDDDAADRIREALDLVTSAAHTRLLAAEFDHRADAVWRYSMLRAAELGDPGLREAAEGRWAELLEHEADPKLAKRIPEGRKDHLAVFVLSTGSPLSLEPCLALAAAKDKEYRRWERYLTGAASHARAGGAAVGDALAAALTDAKGIPARLACLRLLTWAGTKDHAKAVAPSLDAPENNIKVAAINALRRMVDGDDPIDKLSAFEAIERANKWKQRL